MKQILSAFDGKEKIIPFFCSQFSVFLLRILIELRVVFQSIAASSAVPEVSNLCFSEISRQSFLNLIILYYLLNVVKAAFSIFLVCTFPSQGLLLASSLRILLPLRFCLQNLRLLTTILLPSSIRVFQVVWRFLE